MEMEDWALTCSWPPAGDQWQYSVEQFFEPLHLFDNKSDEAECRLFNDDVAVQQNQSFNTAWSTGSSFLEEAVEPNIALASGYLISTPKHAGVGVDVRSLDGRPSAWEELPSSPESFRLISNSELCAGEAGDSHVQWQQESSLNSDESLVSSGVSDIGAVESSDVATVSKCEPSVDDMLLGLDEAISDVIMNPLKLADIGLYLPPVSADDVDSLLSSPSIVAAGPPSLPATASCFPAYHEEFQAENPLILDMETTEAESYVQALSPARSETDLYSISAACSPAYEEQVQVPSPASSQSSSSTVPADRKQRKKQQNKTAAQKYRQKKRGEQGQVVTEYEQLERRNIELRTRVEEMTREVDYLKGLIEEICA